MRTTVNTVKNDDLDELTAMLQSLDEPASNAAKASGVDEIDDLRAGLDDGIAKPVEVVADEVLAADTTEDMSSVFEALETEHEPEQLVEPERDLMAGVCAEPTSEPESIITSVESRQDAADDKAEPPSEAVKPKPQTERKKTERTPGKPRFTLEGKDESFYSAAGLENEVFSAAFEKAPVKAKDKILNLLNWFSGGPEISVYTVIAMRHLLESKSATSNSIKLALMSNPDKPYPLSTASTQAGQMMAVFPATGIALREGGNLTLNEESPIVKKFVAEYSIG